MRKSIYRRPAKPASMPITVRELAAKAAAPTMPTVTAVHVSTECHVTPPEVARRMVEALGPPGDYLTLEPSAGTGNLAQALLDSGHSPFELTLIERDLQLCALLRKRFSQSGRNLNALQECFLAYAKRAAGKVEFPRILMNPPFRHTKAHINAALSLLGRGGHDCATLVALVPITFEHSQAEVIEFLDNDVFISAKVHTKLIRLRR